MIVIRHRFTSHPAARRAFSFKYATRMGNVPQHFAGSFVILLPGGAFGRPSAGTRATLRCLAKGHD
jgi:hypothetical protein